MCPNKYKEIWNKIKYLIKQEDDDNALMITEVYQLIQQTMK